MPDTRGDVRLTCGACGLARAGRSCGPAHGTLRIETAPEGRRWRNPVTRAVRTWPPATDEVHDLWLRAPCCGGELLWAANAEHLGYLERYVRADLRERPEAVVSPMGRRWVGKGLSWKLPAWMKAAKHRDEVLATIAELRATLPTA